MTRKLGVAYTTIWHFHYIYFGIAFSERPLSATNDLDRGVTMYRAAGSLGAEIADYFQNKYFIQYYKGFENIFWEHLFCDLKYTYTPLLLCNNENIH